MSSDNKSMSCLNTSEILPRMRYSKFSHFAIHVLICGWRIRKCAYILEYIAAAITLMLSVRTTTKEETLTYLSTITCFCFASWYPFVLNCGHAKNSGSEGPGLKSRQGREYLAIFTRLKPTQILVRSQGTSKRPWFTVDVKYIISKQNSPLKLHVLNIPVGFIV